MKCHDFKIAAALVFSFVLAFGAVIPAWSADAPGDSLAPAQIIQRSRDAYASLVSYSDEGQVTVSYEQTITRAFTMRLARPNLYRLEWTPPRETYESVPGAVNQVVWSSGAGDFLSTGAPTRAPGSPENALASAAACTGGVAATLPRIFFNLSGNLIDEAGCGLDVHAVRLPDEKLGNLDCYVCASQMLGQTNILWIAKQDFLIRQRRTYVSSDGIQLRLNRSIVGANFTLPGFQAEARSVAITETHTNIVLDHLYAPIDFRPSFALYSSPRTE